MPALANIDCAKMGIDSSGSPIRSVLLDAQADVDDESFLLEVLAVHVDPTEIIESALSAERKSHSPIVHDGISMPDNVIQKGHSLYIFKTKYIL